MELTMVQARHSKVKRAARYGRMLNLRTNDGTYVSKRSEPDIEESTHLLSNATPMISG